MLHIGFILPMRLLCEFEVNSLKITVSFGVKYASFAYLYRRKNPDFIRLLGQNLYHGKFIVYNKTRFSNRGKETKSHPTGRGFQRFGCFNIPAKYTETAFTIFFFIFEKNASAYPILLFVEKAIRCPPLPLIVSAISRFFFLFLLILHPFSHLLALSLIFLPPYVQ